MLKPLLRLFGMAGRPASPPEEYEPVYGFPRQRVEEWLARNPLLRQEYASELLARKAARVRPSPSTPLLFFRRRGASTMPAPSSTSQRQDVPSASRS